ncbi:MAG: hypothetical protein QOE55_1466 [Acidobacteriaceae bacterium]|nr:hypothetical protein [Acidobacteriaceae bacterium]
MRSTHALSPVYFWTYFLTGYVPAMVLLRAISIPIIYVILVYLVRGSLSDQV